MRAVSSHEGVLDVVDLPQPVPGPGQVLLRVVRCGICGSDLHARHHSDASADVAREVGYDHFMRQDHHVVMGHEFVGEVVSYGPRTRGRWDVGTLVATLPVLRHGDQVHMTGLSELAPGGFAEYVIAAEDMTMPVPEGMDVDLAALTEPLAVAHHAVRRGRVGRKEVAIVIGCGPIGLAVICMLKAAGVRTIVASDYSAGRRELARRCGATIVVDPAEQSPWEAYDRPKKHHTTATGLFGEAIDAMHLLQKVPGIPWWRVMRAAEKAGAVPRGPVVFECVGVPGVIEDIVTHAPFRSRVVVVGVCMEPDTFRPTMASNKEIDLIFSFCYDPAEFRETLHLVASGKVDASPLVTGVVGLDEVAQAFDDLADPEQHAKILIDPSR
ncbi:zinc-binding dehydrogenase [Aeromicrobium sp. 636]|uniref:Zinc-binding dehydrogenase n=1 Tax=Aeromicrobium senzhongii TaxID=2663859 RepID=A0A8I0EUZ1_9ACTN|nr:MULTISPECIES: zinc-binding dehydrogenase [Aeromicrobium]MBC9226024.1 zinc-binding dehydrogenase [Aeromicrobium senzhongii]MCQ3998131.1 zinc-binding dehydrogenase [Aeromicrobium sp. 636]